MTEDRNRPEKHIVQIVEDDPEIVRLIERLGPESVARLKKLLSSAEQAIEEATDEAVRAAEAITGEVEADPPKPPCPPKAAEALISLFCNRDMCEAVLGDLDEKFAELAERRGPRIAKAWYWGQAGRSALFFAVRWGRRLLELEAILKRIL